MNDYFGFLNEKDKASLETGRFENMIPDSIYRTVSYLLFQRYDISCGSKTIPANHQIEVFEQMIGAMTDDGFNFALFMEQGLGKTKVTLMMADYLYRKGLIEGVIVIAPNNLKYQWVEEEIPKHYPGEFAGIIWDGFNTQKAKYDFGDVIKSEGKLKVMSINVEAFSSTSVKQYVHMFAKSCNDVLVVIDESTTIKNGRRKTKDASKRKGAKRTNLILDGFMNRKYKMILTGTATPNRPFDLWAQFEFLKYDYFRADYWDFCKRYGEMIQVKRANAKRASLELLDEKTYRMVKADLKGVEMINTHYPINSMETFPEPIIDPIKPFQLEDIALRRGLTESGVLRISKMDELEQFKNLDQLREQISPITYFRKTIEVLDMPPQIYETYPCEMSAEQKKIYKSMVRDMLAEYEGHEISTLHKTVMYIRCQQIAGGLFPYPVELLSEALSAGRDAPSYTTKPITPNGKLIALSSLLDDVSPDRSVIVWAWFTGEQDLIYEMLCKRFGPDKVGLYRNNKKEVETRFKNGEIKYFVSGDSGAFGLNLQVANLQIFYSNNHRADIRDQKEKRSHRMGQLSPVTYIDMVCRNTKDDKILNVLKRKMDLMDYFRTGDIDDGE